MPEIRERGTLDSWVRLVRVLRSVKVFKDADSEVMNHRGDQAEQGGLEVSARRVEHGALEPLSDLFWNGLLILSTPCQGVRA